eukprot:752220-Hanusia_phi.AAC.4
MERERTRTRIKRAHTCGAAAKRWTWQTCRARLKSVSALILSMRRKRISNLDSSAGGRLIFSDGDLLGLYRPYAGLAAAKTDVLALREVVMPALAMETVCCSMTS